jgi:Na+-driven multidrug efflux pump
MVAGIVATVTNFILNLILIFGLLGLPALGVVGAAIATVVSRFAELGVLVVWGHTHKQKCAFLVGAYRSLFVPRHLILQIARKGLPLMLNETLWSIAVTLRNQCYSTRGLDAVAAQNINATITSVLNVTYMAFGSAVAILVGNLLGAGRLEEAKDENRKLTAFSIICGAAMGLMMVGVSFLFPKLYNTTDTVRELATYMIIITACTMPSGAFSHAAYFTLRSGGKVLITFLFDSGFMWGIVIPTCCILAYLTDFSIIALFAVCQGIDILKSLIAAYLVKQGAWVKQIVVNEKN